MRTLCFVTNEIYPEHKGGIGRMLYNIAVTNAGSTEPDRLVFLMSWQPPAAQASIQAALAGLAEVAFCPLSLAADLPWGHAYDVSNPAAWHYGHAYRQALVFYAGLLRLEREANLTFDVIEFPDYSGWGLAAMEAKAAGLAFAETELTVRLHSTGGLIAEHQPYYHAPGPWKAASDDMERQGLIKADRVIGHVAGVIEANRTFYGLPAAWAARCVLEFPPILLDAEELAAGRAAPAPTERDFIFSSRLQPFKQPDLFIKAAVKFLRAHPEYRGRCRLISYGWDEDYIKALAALVPPQLEGRITLETGLSAEDRIAAIAAGIVVIPSNYESLCLFAFEASHLGATLLLNGACAAFGEGSRWHEGRNCLTFDGTVDGLVRRMAEALTFRPAETVSLEASAPYWKAVVFGRPQPGPEGALPGVTVIAHGFADAEAVHQAIARYDAPGVSVLLMLPEALAGEVGALPPSVSAMIVPGAAPWPEDFAQALTACGEDLAAFIGADTVVEPEYLGLARASFARHPDLVAFGCHSRLVGRDGADQGLRIYPGSAPEIALHARDILPDGAVFRTVHLRRLAAQGRAFDGRTEGHWQSDLCRELAFDHALMVVAPHPYVTERAPAIRRPGDPAVDATLIGRLVRRTGSLGSAQALALKPLPRVAKPEDPCLDVSIVLKGATQAWPAPDGADWQPVQYRVSGQDLQLHPLTEGWVMAALPVTRADVPERVIVRVQHYGHDNPGVDIALFAGVGGFDAAVAKALMAGEGLAGLQASDWVRVLPGDHADATLALPVGQPFDWLLVAARPSDGLTTAYAWTHITRVWVA